MVTFTGSYNDQGYTFSYNISIDPITTPPDPEPTGDELPWAPPDGDFCKPGFSGINYVSPGYA